jgi:hypothetical protein
MTALSTDMLELLTRNKTHVIERNGKEALVYLAADGTGHMRLDDGETRSGKWHMIENGYATEWDGGQKGEWQLQITDAGFDYTSRDGKMRLKMLGILFGDARHLAG